MRISKTPQERKIELIAAARRLFDERGIHKTRVSDIVQYVGVAQGVFSCPALAGASLAASGSKRIRAKTRASSK